MGNKVGDSENKIAKDFNLENELSTLVKKDIIPSRIADKLINKLKERNIRITKEQLYKLAYKINDIMKGYDKTEFKPQRTDNQNWKETDTNMEKLVKTVENLEKRIINMETGNTNKYKTYSTDDIELPAGDLAFDPLQNIPNDPESIIVIMKWLQYLIDKCGQENLSNILDYYVDIGWITQDAKISMIDYSHGISREKSKDTTEKVANLPSKDHIQSLIYIQKLKGRHFDKHFIDRIDGELSRITKKLDNYHFK